MVKKRGQVRVRKGTGRPETGGHCSDTVGGTLSSVRVQRPLRIPTEGEHPAVFHCTTF